MNQLGKLSTKEQARAMMKELDVDGDNTIDFTYLLLQISYLLS